MPLADPHAFIMAGFTESDVDEVVEDLGYLLQNSKWPYSVERTADMISESPDILLEFLRSVERSALRSAMIPKRIKNLV